MAKLSMASLALLAALGSGGGAFAQPAPARHAQNDAATTYAELVSKMDQAYHMQFVVPAKPERTAAKTAPAKPAG